MPHSEWTLIMSASDKTEPAKRFDYLSWFLGPKAEQRHWFESELLELFRDYTHWRANYIPGDTILIKRHLLRDLELQHDGGSQRLAELMAKLRGNFPFYSPRYVAHMLSDVSTPSMLGYVAGMLYNCNNITPEAAPVTVDLELDACNAVLEMFGIESAPKPKPSEDVKDYEKRLPSRFGWAHCTFDGTTANIEALWMARNSKMMPLAIKQLATEAAKSNKRFEVRARLPNGTSELVQAVDDRQLLMMTPTDVLDLVDAYLEEYLRNNYTTSQKPDKVWKAAWNSLRECRGNIRNSGIGKAISECRAQIYVSGAGHYSIGKAIDILGLGRDSMCVVDVDTKCRLNVGKLRQRILDDIENKARFPLAVVCVLSTTEEGAVDPLADVLSLRAEIEREYNASFWVHTDAAWGGFMRSVFVPDPQWLIRYAAERFCAVMGIGSTPDKGVGGDRAYDRILQWIDKLLLESHDKDKKEALTASKRTVHRLGQMYDNQEYDKLIGEIAGLVDEFSRAGVAVPPSVQVPSKDDIVSLVRDDTNWTVNLSLGGEQVAISAPWRDTSVYDAFLSMHDSDSIVCDPHKMGYCVYPSGMVAYRDNRVRHSLSQDAPYITSHGTSKGTRLPPRYPGARAKADAAHDPRTAPGIEAFGPYILEGSRPGAMATALWLSLQCMPLHKMGHGNLIRDVLRSARVLHEWLFHWSDLCERIREDCRCEFVTLVDGPPDTNVLTFAVVSKADRTLATTNRLTKRVYKDFAIEIELGDGRTSYNQPFFVSHNRVAPPLYPFQSLQSFFSRAKLRDVTLGEYERQGVFVLRATVMNPYHQASWEMGGNSFIREFVQALGRSADTHEREPATRDEDDDS